MCRCLHNIRSILLVHNAFIVILEDGLIAGLEERIPILLKWSASFYYVKISSIMNLAATKETHCEAEDTSFDEYFIDESQFDIQPTVCEAGYFDAQIGYIKLPSCLRAL